MVNAFYNEEKKDEPINVLTPLENNSISMGGTTVLPRVGSQILKTPKIGGETLQYTIVNAGIITFGDGSDGDTVISANTTLTSDKYYKNLTVLSGVTLNPGGYRIFVSEKCIIDGTIARNGNNGGNGARITAGIAATALADGYLKGASAAAGGEGGDVAGEDGFVGGTGQTAANSIGSVGIIGGAGGTGDATNPGGAGGPAGTFTASNVALIAGIQLIELLDVSSTGAKVKFNNSSGAGGGGGGGFGTNAGVDGGGGGGSGTAGGIIAIYAKNLIINANGSITASGGNGGNGFVCASRCIVFLHSFIDPWFKLIYVHCCQYFAIVS